MSYTGNEFMDVLDDLCKENKTTISAFLLSIGRQKSLAGSIRGAKRPNRYVVEEAAKRFGVSSAWLLGESDEKHGDNVFILNSLEAELITGLRGTDEQTRKSVYKMASAVLSAPQIAPTEAIPEPVLHGSKDDSIHHKPRKRRPLKRVEGNAAAGLPIEAISDDETLITVPAKYLSDRYLIVRAHGDSMIDANIDSGDYCVFDSQAYADDGTIVLAQVEGMTDQSNATIKRVYRHGRQVELRPDNRAYEPMFFPADDVRVTGALAAILSPDA